jgi:ornithine decarboxylase
MAVAGCNPHPRIATTLARLGVGFEVAAPDELRLFLAAGVPAGQMTCLHTVKAPAFVRQLHEAGVAVHAVDSQEEVEKVACTAPGRQVLVRLEVSGRGSRCPLGGKFGCPPGEAVGLFRLARRVGLRPAGVTLHVGSQCESLATWAEALRECRLVCERLAAGGTPADVVSLGGGLPVPYTAGVPGLEAVGRVIHEAEPHRFGREGCRVTLEPGRAIAATAGTLVASVVGASTRGGTRWVYLDAGVYHGLSEWLPACGGLTMPITAKPRGRPLRPCRLAGPTCDSLDTLPGLFRLPELHPGDRPAFHYAGAYSTAVATNFNGFQPPATVLLDAGEEGVSARIDQAG